METCERQVNTKDGEKNVLEHGGRLQTRSDSLRTFSLLESDFTPCLTSSQQRHETALRMGSDDPDDPTPDTGTLSLTQDAGQCPAQARRWTHTDHSREPATLHTLQALKALSYQEGVLCLAVSDKHVM